MGISCPECYKKSLTVTYTVMTNFYHLNEFVVVTKWNDANI